MIQWAQFDLKVGFVGNCIRWYFRIGFFCGLRSTWSYSKLIVQKLGGNAMLVDAEHAFDPAYSKALGVDVENLIVCQPDNGEMALESNCFPLTWLNMLWWLTVSYGAPFTCLNKFCVTSVADRMCRSGAVDLICIDSVSALTPRAEIEVRNMLLFYTLEPHDFSPKPSIQFMLLCTGRNWNAANGFAGKAYESSDA